MRMLCKSISEMTIVHSACKDLNLLDKYGKFKSNVNAFRPNWQNPLSKKLKLINCKRSVKLPMGNSCSVFK